MSPLVRWMVKGSVSLVRANGWLAVSTCTLISSLALTSAGSGILAFQRDGLWVAFRYDENRVLFYADKLRDPVRQDYSRSLKAPVARHGAGGYLLPLTAERLRTFRALEPRAGTEGATGSVIAPSIGQQLTLML